MPDVIVRTSCLALRPGFFRSGAFHALACVAVGSDCHPWAMAKPLRNSLCQNTSAPPSSSPQTMPAVHITLNHPVRYNLRKAIWGRFPCVVIKCGRDASGAERHSVQWHHSKIKAAWRSSADYATTLRDLMAFLRSSTAWVVEDAESVDDFELPGQGYVIEKEVCMIRMTFTKRHEDSVVSATTRTASDGQHSQTTSEGLSVDPEAKDESEDDVDDAGSAHSAAVAMVSHVASLPGVSELEAYKGINDLVNGPVYKILLDDFNKHVASLPRFIDDLWHSCPPPGLFHWDLFILNNDLQFKWLHSQKLFPEHEFYMLWRVKTWMGQGAVRSLV